MMSPIFFLVCRNQVMYCVFVESRFNDKTFALSGQIKRVTQVTFGSMNRKQNVINITDVKQDLKEAQQV